MSKISVIVPVYKVEKYIHRCVDSILEQSYADFELILVDDGSPENCGIICDEYAAKDDRVVVIHQKNRGLSAARNAGIDWVFANSDSQWITFVDSDDWVHPKYLSVLYDGAIRHGVKISMCAFVRTVETSQPEPVFQPFEVKTPAQVYLRVNDRVTAYAWGALYDRDSFRDVRFPAGKIYEDVFTTYKVIFATDRIAYSDTGLYYYYRNIEGISLRSWRPACLDEFEAYETVLRAFKKDPVMHKAVMVSYLEALQRGYGKLLKLAQKNKEAYDPYRLILLRKLRKGVAMAHIRKYTGIEKNASLYEITFPGLMRRYRRRKNDRKTQKP